MQKQIEELKRPSEQVPALQGEVQELETKVPLRTKFPADTIELYQGGAWG